MRLREAMVDPSKDSFFPMPGELPRIVVVEDDTSMSRAIARILRAGGFSPETFASAEAALAAEAVTRADCLVLDVHLPGISGFLLYEHVVSSGVHVPTIFITAHDEPSIRATAERMGATSYLAKPFSGRTLLDAVTQALASP